jgi:PAS domain S-box-containing protein
MSSQCEVTSAARPRIPTFSEDHYRTLFEKIDRGFCTIEVLFDEAGRAIDYVFLDVNPLFEEQTGLSNAVGRRMRELAPNHEGDWYRIYGEVATSGAPARFEMEAASLHRWYEVYAFRVDDPHVHHVAILFTDISDRKAAERALHASEARYRALAHAASNSIYRLDSQGTQLLEVYGGPIPSHASTIAPSTTWLEDYVHPDDREGIRVAWSSSVAKGAPFALELRGRLADGSWGWIVSRAVPIRNDQGEIVEWIGSATDITERKQAEAALLRSEAEHASARRDAENANRTKDEFLAMLGHELRNPLAPMLTALQLMRLRGGQSRELDVLERQVKHLARMVDDLLDVSRIARGVMELKKQPLELSVAVIRALETAGPLLEQRANYVDVQVPRVGLVVDADRDRMAQVFANLLTNASKYSEVGSRIVVSAQRDDGRIRISVKDEGIGIAGDMLDSVFDAFVQQPQALERSSGGMGLGLAIVRSIVSAHGGRAWVESAGLGRGSEFIVELPAAMVGGAPTLETRHRARPAEDGSRRRILVVDDNEDATTMMRAALEHLGYVVDVARSGPSALAKASTFQPSTILLDIGIPLMDGYEVARRLRAQPDGDKVQLLAVTGYGQEADRRRTRDAGFDEHIVKPIDLDYLEQLIENSSWRTL